MSVKLLSLCLLLVLLCPSWAKRQRCSTSASNCEECIQSGPECAWCTGSYSNVRCHNLKGLRRAGCRESDIYNPQGRVQVVRNEPTNAKALFLQPQQISLHLRPGVNQSFPLTITMPADQPTTELTMDSSPVPAGVNITFSGIVNGNPLIVQVNVEAAQCPTDSDDSNQKQNRTGPWSLHITPRGFSQSVKLEITLECQCDCTRNREENSSFCAAREDLVCGQCVSNDRFPGQHYQMIMDSSTCRPDPSYTLCSARGKCVEGSCECEKRINPNERYSGQYCQCSNFDCPYHYGSICGGHGRCECGHCVCDDDWTGKDCSCALGTASCMAKSGLRCNGKGNCICGKCECSGRYTGPTCEECPLCHGVCGKYAECVECRAFGTGAKKDRCDQECGNLRLAMVETKDDLPLPSTTTISSHCKERSLDDCFFYYAFFATSSGIELTVARVKECSTYIQFFSRI